jgi:lipopolysaccharide/colanic/teichoic acid biosynthesis glycosyltransferase
MTMYYDVSANYKAVNEQSEREFLLISLMDDLQTRVDYLAFKRVTDIILSLLLCIISLPVLLLIAILIKIESRGPVFFKQNRVGQNGKEFVMFKFRSMRCTGTVVMVGRDGTLAKSKNDWRITRIGKIIRKTSIDELPQFFNVLIGNMSLVGPRPLIRQMVEPYPYISRVRSLVKPGITGSWQITCREKNTSILDMIDLDLHYIKNCRLSMDFAILVKTLKVVLSGRGAM